MTTESILARLVEIGKVVAWRANPQSHACEYRDRAKRYEPELAACRTAYQQIRAGAYAPTELRKIARLVTGIEGNAIRLLIRDLDAS